MVKLCTCLHPDESTTAIKMQISAVLESILSKRDEVTDGLKFWFRQEWEKVTVAAIEDKIVEGKSLRPGLTRLIMIISPF
jgi:hypothetical protein